MKPVFSSRWSSAAIALHFGSSNHRRGCFTVRAFESTLNACSTSSLETPGMSEGHRAKISQRSLRNSTSTLSYAGSRSTAIDVIFSGSVGWTWTFLESQVESKAWSGRDQPTLGSTLWSVSPMIRAYSSVMPKVCAILWNSFCHMYLKLQNFLWSWWSCVALGFSTRDMHSEGLPWYAQMLVARELPGIVTAIT
jgi:hypothetical protein